jgi:Protein of unknown function (DUF1570)
MRSWCMRSGSCVAVAGLAGALCSAWLSAQGLPKADSSWVEAKTPHFTVVSNGRESEAAAAAEDLERFHALLATLRRADANLPLPTMVFAFRNTSSFRTYSPWPERDDVAGFFVPGRYRNFLALDLAPRGDSSGTLYHEYVHQFVADNFPEVPLWFNEGLAEYYSNFQVERGEALVGRPIPEHLEALRVNGLVPIGDLVTATTDSAAYNESDRAGIFYAQAWATVHYLLSDPARSRQVVRYLDALADGKDTDAAFREAFGREYVDLRRELERYVASSRFAFQRVPLPEVAVSVDREPLAPARALALLGDFVASYQPPRRDQAAAHFDAALELDATEPIALAGRGLVQELDGDLDAAFAAYERAAASAPQDPHPSLLLGLAGVERLRRLGVPAVSTPEQQQLARTSRAALERVLELSPQLAVARVALGLTYLWEGDPRAGIAVLTEAKRTSPSRPELYLGLAVLAARADGFTEAWLATDALERVEAAKPSAFARPELAEYARLAVASIQLERARRAANEGQDQAALDLVASLEPRLGPLVAAGAQEAPQLVEQVAKLRAHVRRSQAVRALQAAAELANRREFGPALVEVERILKAGIEDDDLRGRAEELRRAILRVLGAEPN